VKTSTTLETASSQQPDQASTRHLATFSLSTRRFPGISHRLSATTPATPAR
jgi:hypothetical protein